MFSSAFNTKTHSNQLVIERLTALWALNECGLGGFMHAISSPFTGIFVGGISILLITLIASNAKSVWPTLLKSLSIVLLVKLSVSPHSPITSYFAVSFQAFLGMVLYSIFSVNRITTVLLGVVTFLESALQKLLTLTILYGETLWEAIDLYAGWIGDKIPLLVPVLSAEALIWTYIGIYGTAGIIVGLMIIRILKVMRTMELSVSPHLSNGPELLPTRKTGGSLARKTLGFWIMALVIILLPLLFFNSELDGWRAGVYLVARSAVILLAYYFLIGPLLLKVLNMILARRRSAYENDIRNTLSLLPHLRSILQFAWKDCDSLKGLNRIQHFMARSIVYSVHFNPRKS